MFKLKKLSTLPLQSSLRGRTLDFLKANESYCGLLVGNLFLNGDSIKEGQIYSGDYKVFINDENSDDLQQADMSSCDDFKQVGGVYCHFVAGNLLFHFNKHLDEKVKTNLIEQMIDETLQDGIPLKGVIGDYPIANSIVEKFFETKIWNREQLSLFQKENLYQYDLSTYDDSIFHSDPNILLRKITDLDSEQYFTCMKLFETDIFGEPKSTKEHSDYLLKTTLNYGAFVGEELVSTVRINSHSDKHCTLGFVFTKPEHRRKGIAKILFKVLFAECIKMGFSHVDLFTNLDNSANHFYQNLGFKNIGEMGLFIVSN